MHFIFIFCIMLLCSCSARIDAGFAIDATHTHDEYEPFMGIIRVSQDVDPRGQFYYEHISHVTTEKDGSGINLFGFNYRLK